MAKLSQQQPPQLSQARVTRTQRVLAKQQVAKRSVAFGNLQEQARKKHQEEFSDIKTLEEYEKKYNQLPSSLKQFFATPMQLQQEQTQRIQINITKVKADIVDANQKLITLDQEYKKSQDQAGKIKDSKSRSDEFRRLADRYNEESAYWKNYESALNEGLGKLQGNQDISYGDTQDFAEQKGSYYRERQEARNTRTRTNKKAFDKLLQTSAFGETFRKYETAYKGKIDWTDPKNVSSILEQEFASRQPDEWIKQKTTGLTKQDTITRGKSEVTYWVDDKGKKQIELIRGTESGILQYKEVGKRFGGQVTRFQGLSDVDIKKQAKAEFKLEDVKKPYYLDVETLDVSKAGRITRGTISDQPPVAFVPVKVTPPPKEVGRVKKIITKVRDFIPDLYYNPPNINQLIGVGGVGSIISIGKTSKESINLRELEQRRIAKITSKSGVLNLAKIEGLGIKEKIDVRFQEEYQTRFDRKYMEDLIDEKITFEEAQKQFGEGEEAGIISKKYQTAVDKAVKKSSTPKDILTLNFLKQVKHSGERIFWTVTPTTPEGAVVETAVIVSGAKLLKSIPLVYSNIATGVLGGYGTFKLISPTSTLSERAGGGITALLSFGILGFQGVKYLRKPTIKTVKIPSPKITVKTHAIGKEAGTINIKYMGETSKISKVVYGKQKLSQLGISGRRTVVSTKWRSILNKHGFKFDPIYKGVPYQQQGTRYVYESIRGTYEVRGLSGYQKALKLLTKRGGFTPSQAKASLRYYQPRVVDVVLEKGKILIHTGEKGSKAIGKFSYLTEQPIITVSKNLGIKTRGARTIRDIIDFERGVEKTMKGHSIILEKGTKTTSFVTPEGFSFNVLKQAGKTQVKYAQRSLVKVGDVEKAILRLRADSPQYTVTKDLPYTYQDLTSVFVRKQLIPKLRKLEFGEAKAQIIKIAKGKEIPTLNLDEIYGIKATKDIVAKTQIKKTAWTKTFGTESVDDIKDLIKTKSVKSFDVDKVASKINQIASGTDKTVSQYYGKGLYERTVGGSVPSGVQFHSPLEVDSLKAISIPKIKVIQNLKNIMKIEQVGKVGLKTSSVLGLSLAGALRLDSGLKSDLKTNLKMRQQTGMKLNQLVKQDMGLKSASTLKQALKLESSLVSLPLTTLGFQPPALKIPPQPSMNIPFLLTLGEVKRKRKKKKKSKLVQDLLFLPDFTSRALGLKEITLTEKQAQKQLKKLLTGLEIRKPVKVKFK